jgi:hypothetical protein
MTNMTIQEKILNYLAKEIAETKEKLEKLEAMYVRADSTPDELFNSIAGVVKYYMNDTRGLKDNDN